MLYGSLLVLFDAFMFFECFVVLVVRVCCACVLLCDVARVVFVFVVSVCL